MTAVDVLAPLRLETRFLPDEAGGWRLRLRVYPDDFSLARNPNPPTAAELDILADALTGLDQGGADAEAVAFRRAAGALGARRAWWLWRSATTQVVEDGQPHRVVDRSGEADPELRVAAPIGLPDTLDVWLQFTDGSRRLAGTLPLDLAAIADDLDPAKLNQTGDRLPTLWWLDYQRAVDVGLATEFPLSDAEADGLAVLVVVGGGSTAAAELIGAHLASGRLAALAQGTPTNTVHGEPTTDVGDDPDTWLGLLHGTAADQPLTRGLLTAFGFDGAAIAGRPTMPGGDLDHATAGRAAVRGLWPLLWGRTLRDVVGAGRVEPDVAQWAGRRLAVQGPLPAIRVGEQPYGLLPASVFTRWRADPADDPATTALEDRILAWTTRWRAGAATHAALAEPEPMLELLGRHAPSAHWKVRPVLDLATLQAAQFQQGLALSRLTDHDRGTALAWRGIPRPRAPIAAAGTARHLPGPPEDARDDPGLLDELLSMHPEPLYYQQDWDLGLIGRLIRETMLAIRATVGRALLDWQDTGAIDPFRPIPLDDDYPQAVQNGDDPNLETIRAASGEGGFVADRFDRVRDGLRRLIEVYATDPEGTVRAVKATLDTASFRVDPWLTGVATRRLERFAAAGAPFLLGAYGWVDEPRPWRPGDVDRLPPGPTAAGLLHAPSFAQAQVAALLRDAAVREPQGRWDLQLTAAKVRAAVAFGERIRLGVHPWEALGLEVEAVAGDPDVVRELRRHFPTTPEESPDGGAAPAEPNDPTRRVCNGVGVLKAVREGALPASVPAGLAAELAPLEVLFDTYADLLLVDGVHALVTRSPEAGGAAMEAAAGLSSPPELRGIRTPRNATTVSVQCWLVLPGAAAEVGGDPATQADPAFAAQLPPGALDDPDDPDATALALVAGGTDPWAAPGDELEALVAAATAELTQRWHTMTQLAEAAVAGVAALDPEGPEAAAELDRVDRHWRLGLRAEQPDWSNADRREEALTGLRERLRPVADGAPGTLAELRAQLRTLLGRPWLPILPIVSRALLPPWNPVPEGRLDQEWLEIVAAVQPRLAPLEARQLTAATPWPAAVQAPGDDPWAPSGPVRVAYGSGLDDPGDQVAVALLDGWVDSIPSREHVTQAAFGFNAPRTRAPQAVLLAVPNEVSQRLTGEDLFDLVLQVRELALARAARPGDRAGLPYATPAPLLQLQDPVNPLARRA